MHEATLKQFFLGTVDARQLAEELSKSAIEDGPLLILHQVTEMERDFTVRVEHLLRLCDAVLDGIIGTHYLEVIARWLVGSEKFEYETGTRIEGLVGRTVLEWSAPSTDGTLTMDAIRKTRNLLTAASVKTVRPTSQFA